MALTGPAAGIAAGFGAMNDWDKIRTSERIANMENQARNRAIASQERMNQAQLAMTERGLDRQDRALEQQATLAREQMAHQKLISQMDNDAKLAVQMMARSAQRENLLMGKQLDMQKWWGTEGVKVMKDMEVLKQDMLGTKLESAGAALAYGGDFSAMGPMLEEIFGGKVLGFGQGTDGSYILNMQGGDGKVRNMRFQSLYDAANWGMNAGAAHLNIKAPLRLLNPSSPDAADTMVKKIEKRADGLAKIYGYPKELAYKKAFAIENDLLKFDSMGAPGKKLVDLTKEMVDEREMLNYRALENAQQMGGVQGSGASGSWGGNDTLVGGVGDDGLGGGAGSDTLPAGITPAADVMYTPLDKMPKADEVMADINARGGITPYMAEAAAKATAQGKASPQTQKDLTKKEGTGIKLSGKDVTIDDLERILGKRRPKSEEASPLPIQQTEAGAGELMGTDGTTVVPTRGGRIAFDAFRAPGEGVNRKKGGGQAGIQPKGTLPDNMRITPEQADELMAALPEALGKMSAVAKKIDTDIDTLYARARQDFYATYFPKKNMGAPETGQGKSRRRGEDLKNFMSLLAEMGVNVTPESVAMMMMAGQSGRRGMVESNKRRKAKKNKK